jgi:cation diffusion facilitator CzcD-associated flavoprotein CzcO
MTVTETRPETRPGGDGAVEHVDVLVVGAGVAGIGAGHHLRERFPERSFAILDALPDRGGTWWTHRYPGARSDSDLFTYGYRHKPWRGPSIASSEEILAYLDEVIEEDGLKEVTRYQHKVVVTSWSSADMRWTVDVRRDGSGGASGATGDGSGETFRMTCGFL